MLDIIERTHLIRVKTKEILHSLIRHPLILNAIEKK